MTYRKIGLLALNLGLWFSLVSDGVILGQEPFRLIPSARFAIGMEWSDQWLSGEVLIPSGGRLGSGSKIDVYSVLGIDGGQASHVIFRSSLGQRHSLDADFMMFAPSALQRTPASFIFHNRTYNMGTLLESRLDFNWFRVVYGYEFLKFASVSLIPRIGMHYISFSCTINGDSEGYPRSSNTRSLDSIFPVVGLCVRNNLPYGLDLEMELEGIHLISMGYLIMSRVGTKWQFHPDIAARASIFSRIVGREEDNQKLNNEWRFGMLGLSLGISFGF
jgi:hypothetical protein